jgi:hypothetical protein
MNRPRVYTRLKVNLDRCAWLIASAIVLWAAPAVAQRGSPAVAVPPPLPRPPWSTPAVPSAQVTSSVSPSRALATPMPARDPGGWTMFGAQTGFFLATAVGGGLAYVAASGTSPALQTAAIIGTPVVAIGLTVAGAFGARALALRFGGDRAAGWGAAGVWPGAFLGLAMATAAVATIDPTARVESQVLAAALGVGLGGAAGYAVFRAIASERQRVGWSFVGFWTGFLAGEVAGIVAQSGTGSAVPMLLCAAAGGFTGLVVSTLASR